MAIQYPTTQYSTTRYTTTAPADLLRYVDDAQQAAARWLSRYSIDALRISLGLVFLGFGVLKFFPGLSPAAELATRTMETLTLGIVTGPVALGAVAVMECFVGLTLVSGRLLRTGSRCWRLAGRDHVPARAVRRRPVPRRADAGGAVRAQGRRARHRGAGRRGEGAGRPTGRTGWAPVTTPRARPGDPTAPAASTQPDVGGDQPRAPRRPTIPLSTRPDPEEPDHGIHDTHPETVPPERARPQGDLVVHIVSAALWFGVDIALGILVLTAMLTADPVTAGISLQAVDLFAVWPMLGASLVCLGTGVVLGIGSKYGLVRYWWVAVKFAINVLMSILIFFSLRPGIGEATGVGEWLLAGDPTAVVPDGLIYPVVVAPTLLLIAYLLSTVKPWGRTRRLPTPTTTSPAQAELAPIGVRS